MAWKASKGTRIQMLKMLKNNIFDDGVIDCYGGTRPSSPDGAEGSTRLLRISVDGGTFTAGSSTNALTPEITVDTSAETLYLTKPSDETWQGTVTLAGTLTWFRWRANGAQEGAADFITAPGAPTVALAGDGAGNVDDGAHTYLVTYYSLEGETEGGTASSAVTVTDNGSNGKVDVTGIPVSSDSNVVGRKIYRSKAGTTSPLYLLTTITDNTTTTYEDNTADSGLGAVLEDYNTTWPTRLDGTIGTSGAEMTVSTTNAVVGNEITIDTIEITIPESR